MTTKVSHNMLSFAEYRKVEECIKAVWTAQGYKPGASDESVAVTASKLLSRSVNASNVKFVRTSVGLLMNGTSLSKRELHRLETVLNTGEPTVVVRRKNRKLMLYPLATFLRMSSTFKARKPWMAAAASHRATNGVTATA